MRKLSHAIVLWQRLGFKIAVTVFIASFSNFVKADLLGVSFNPDTSKIDLYRIDENNSSSSLVSHTTLSGWSLGGTLFTQDNSAVIFSGGNELRSINISSGVENIVTLNRDFNAIDAAQNGLVGIRFNGTTLQNELYTIDLNTGSDSLITSFNFASGFYDVSSFRVDAINNFAYAASNGQIYQFNLNNGSYLSFSTSPTFNGYDLDINGNLIGISHDFPNSILSLYNVDSSTFSSSFLTSINFSGGLPSGSFFTSNFESKAYLNAGALFQFDLQNGITASNTLDRSYSALTSFQAMSSTVPEPESYAMFLAGVGLLCLAKRRKEAINT